MKWKIKACVLYVALLVSNRTAFGQSNQVLFVAAGFPSTRLVWDNWSTVANKADASNHVAFLWATTGTPLVETQTGILQTATNGSSVYDISMAWTDILTDPNYHFGTNGTAMVVANTTTIGNYAYNGGAFFTLADAPATTNIQIFVIAWPNLWANPFDAAAAGAPVGWSMPFSYALGTLPDNAPLSFSASTTFDNLRIGEIIPEPTAATLFAFASTALIIFRRRK